MLKIDKLSEEMTTEEFEQKMRLWKNKNSIFFEDLLSSKKAEKMKTILEGIT